MFQKHNTEQPKLFYKNIPIYADSDEPHRVVADQIKRLLPDGGRVLDLGSGAGSLSQRIMDMGYEVTAADISQSAFLGDGDFISVDLNKDFTGKFGGKKYDCIVAIEVLEHLENPLHFLRQINLLLAQGGEFALISFPNIYIYLATISFFKNWDFVNWNTNQYWSTGHQTILTDWLFEQHCKKNNLQISDKIFCSKLPVSKNIIKRSIVYLYLKIGSRQLKHV